MNIRYSSVLHSLFRQLMKKVQAYEGTGLLIYHHIYWPRNIYNNSRNTFKKFYT